MGMLGGLGQGLQGAGDIFLKWALAKEDQKQQAIRNALAQEAAARDQQQIDLQQDRANQESARFIVQNSPADTPLGPAERAFLEGNQMGSFVRPDLAYDGPPPVVEGGLGTAPSGALTAQSGGMMPAADSGRGYTVPTEDARARSQAAAHQAALTRVMTQQAGATQRTQARIQSNEGIAAQRNALAAERNRIAQAMVTARTQGDLLSYQAALMRITQMEQALDQQLAIETGRQDFNWGPGLANTQFDNELNAYEAQHGAGRGGGGGMDMLTMWNTMKNGQAPAAGATPTAAPPKPPAPQPPAAAARPPAPMPARKLQPTPGVIQRNSAGDFVMWDGAQFVVVPPEEATKMLAAQPGGVK
jgi:hypothetical protein